MAYSKSLKKRAIQLATNGISAETIADTFSKEVRFGKDLRSPDPRTIRRWIQLCKQPTNWIDAHKAKTGKLPPLPDYLLPMVNNYSAGEPISKKINPIPLNHKVWAKLSHSQQKELGQLIEWLGKDPQDYVKDIWLPRVPLKWW